MSVLPDRFQLFRYRLKLTTRWGLMFTSKEFGTIEEAQEALTRRLSEDWLVLWTGCVQQVNPNPDISMWGDNKWDLENTRQIGLPWPGDYVATDATNEVYFCPETAIAADLVLGVIPSGDYVAAEAS
jgi:hypothetical protein